MAVVSSKVIAPYEILVGEEDFASESKSVLYEDAASANLIPTYDDRSYCAQVEIAIGTHRCSCPCVHVLEDSSRHPYAVEVSANRRKWTYVWLSTVSESESGTWNHPSGGLWALVTVKSSSLCRVCSGCESGILIANQTGSSSWSSWSNC